MAIAILGLGKTGISVANYFASLGEAVWGIDDSTAIDREKLGAGFTELYLGGKLPDFSKVSRIFISPGVSPNHPAARGAASHGLKLEGELELAFTLCRGKVIAITGTNGKSTTTSLLGAIYREAGLNVGIGGNLGTPFLDLVRDPKNFSTYVVEVSSYQLETISTFRPNVAALLNVTEDHLDRYASFRDYLAAKARIFEFQTERDFSVYNDDDLHCLEAVEGSRGRRTPFSTAKKVRGAYGVKDRVIVWAPEGKPESEFDLKDCKLVGLHNLENIACTVACAKADGLPDAPIQKTLGSFRGLPHRIEWVAELDGVQYYDDSKGTNVGAVVMSLASFDRDVVLILGGRDKGGDYAPLRPLLKTKARAVVVLGEAKEKIIANLQGATEIVSVGSMQEAVTASRRLAAPGGTVLLSPACSSFDMFRDYHDRGEQFKKAVLDLNR